MYEPILNQEVVTEVAISFSLALWSVLPLVLMFKDCGSGTATELRTLNKYMAMVVNKLEDMCKEMRNIRHELKEIREEGKK